MKKYLAPALLACMLLLPGCTGTPSTSTTTPTTTPVSTTQAWATQLCGFEPAAETVAAIFAANPYVATAETVARAICASVTSKSATAGGTPKVGKVRIRGHFVR